MKKRLIILVGMLAMLLAAAVPALAQEASPPGTITVTGVVEIAATDGATDNDYGIVDEASGAGFFLKGDADFGALEGQRVTAYGVEDPESAQRTLNVSRIEPADGPNTPPPARTATPPEAITPDDSGSGSPGSSGGSGSGGTGKSNSGGGSSGSGDSGSGGEAKSGGAKAKELPRTGGETLPALGLVGALLVGGGLLVRRAAR